jgi:hypothetical protein
MERRVCRKNTEEAETEGFMETPDKNKCSHRVNVHQSSIAGCVWFGAWLFTIGYLHLSFWRGALALIIWPYYIGVHASMLPR